MDIYWFILKILFTIFTWMPHLLTYIILIQYEYRKYLIRLIYFIVQPPKINVFLQLIFFCPFYRLYVYNKVGNVLLTHIYLLVYVLTSIYMMSFPVCWCCFITVYACVLLFSQTKIYFKRKTIQRIKKQELFALLRVFGRSNRDVWQNNESMNINVETPCVLEWQSCLVFSSVLLFLL